MKSYKEAWALAKCGKSVGESNMYEAGGRHSLQRSRCTMLKAINHLRSLSDEAHRIINLIDLTLGFDVLSGNYNKILRLMQGTREKAAKQDDLILWCLQSMYVLLGRWGSNPGGFQGGLLYQAEGGHPPGFPRPLCKMRSWSTSAHWWRACKRLTQSCQTN